MKNVQVQLIFVNKGFSIDCYVSRVPCLGENIWVAGEEGRVIEVLHLAVKDPFSTAEARILVEPINKWRAYETNCRFYANGVIPRPLD